MIVIFVFLRHLLLRTLCSSLLGFFGSKKAFSLLSFLGQLYDLVLERLLRLIVRRHEGDAHACALALFQSDFGSILVFLARAHPDYEVHQVSVAVTGSFLCLYIGFLIIYIFDEKQSFFGSSLGLGQLAHDESQVSLLLEELRG